MWRTIYWKLFPIMELFYIVVYVGLEMRLKINGWNPRYIYFDHWLFHCRTLNNKRNNFMDHKLILYFIYYRRFLIYIINYQFWPKFIITSIYPKKLMFFPTSIFVWFTSYLFWHHSLLLVIVLNEINGEVIIAY